MLTLKGYQKRAIDTLDGFLSKARDMCVSAYPPAVEKPCWHRMPLSQPPKVIWIRIFLLPCGWFPATPFGNKLSRR